MGKLTVLFLAAFVDMIGLAMIVPQLPYYASSLGLSATGVGALVGVYSLAQFASAPFWGRLSDRYGRRPAIVTGLTITAVAYMVFAGARSIPLLFAARALQGLGAGTIGVVQAYVTDTGPIESRTRRLGWLSAVTSLGAVAGPALGSFFITLGGPNAPGLAAAVLSIAVAIMAAARLDETTYERTSEFLAPAATTGREALRTVCADWNAPPTRFVWLYAIGIGAFYGTFPIMPLLFESRLGITEHTIGYVVMYVGAVGLLVRGLALGRIIDRLGEQRMIQSGIILLAAGLVMVAQVTGWWSLFIALTLMPLGTACLFPAVTAGLSSAVRRSERGMFLGIQQMMGGAARVVFPLAAGFMIDRGEVGLPFTIAGGLVLLTLVMAKPAAARSPSHSREFPVPA